MTDLGRRLEYLERLGYRVVAVPTSFGSVSHTLQSPQGEPLGKLYLMLGDTATHRLLDQYGCPRLTWWRRLWAFLRGQR